MIIKAYIVVVLTMSPSETQNRENLATRSSPTTLVYESIEDCYEGAEQLLNNLVSDDMPDRYELDVLATTCQPVFIYKEY